MSTKSTVMSTKEKAPLSTTFIDSAQDKVAWSFPFIVFRHPCVFEVPFRTLYFVAADTLRCLTRHIAEN
jgi:hypothetical protein